MGHIWTAIGDGGGHNPLKVRLLLDYTCCVVPTSKRSNLPGGRSDQATSAPACPNCGVRVRVRLGDGRYFCSGCRCRFADPGAWSSIRLPERTKLALVSRFVAGQHASKDYGGARGSIRTRERVARLCRSVCAIEVGLTHRWRFDQFTPPGRKSAGANWAGVTIKVVGDRVHAQAFDLRDLSVVGRAGSTGSHRADIWFPVYGSRVRGPDVADGLLDSVKSLEPRLDGLRKSLEISLGSIPVMPCGLLHLYFAEALMRTDYARFSDPQSEFASWLRKELRRRTSAELRAVADLNATC